MATTSRSSELELASSSPLPAHLLAALELVFLPVQESETSQLTYSTTFKALLARHASQHVKEQHLHIDVPPTGCFSTMPPSPLLTPSPHLTSPSAPEELCMASLTAHHVTLGPGDLRDSAALAQLSKSAHGTPQQLDDSNRVTCTPRPSLTPYTEQHSSEQDMVMGTPSGTSQHHQPQQHQQDHQQQQKGEEQQQEQAEGGPGTRDVSHHSSLSAARGATTVSPSLKAGAPTPDDEQAPGVHHSSSPPPSPHPNDMPDDTAQDHGSRQASPVTQKRRHEDSQEEDRDSVPPASRLRRHDRRLDDTPSRPYSYSRTGPHLPHTRSRPLVDIEHDYLQHAAQFLEDAGPRGVSWQEMRARCPLPRVLLRPGEPPTAWFAARTHLFELGPEGVRLRVRVGPQHSRTHAQPPHRQPVGWASPPSTRGHSGVRGSSGREAVHAYELTLCRYLDDQPAPVPVTSLRHACPAPPAVLDLDGAHGIAGFLDSRPALFLVDPVAHTVTTCSGWWQALGVGPPAHGHHASRAGRGGSHSPYVYNPRRGSQGRPSARVHHDREEGRSHRRRYRSRSRSRSRHRHSRSRSRSRSLSRRGSVRSSSRSSRGSGRPSTPRSSTSRGGSASTATGTAAGSEI